MRFSEWRSALVSSQMMSAIISSLAGDPATMRMAAWFSGIPMTTILGEAVQVMGKGGEVFAAQMGVAMDSMVFGILQDNRIMGQTIRLGVLGRLGPAAIRAQGLRAWTARNREMWALGSFAHTYNMRQKAWDDLDAPFRDSLKRYGMNRDDWDVVRSTKPYFPRQGAGYIRAIDIDDSTPAGRQAAERFSQWVTTEMDYAILDRNMRARALIVGGSRPGTLHGEAVRSFGMYRMFTAAFMSTVMMRTTARGFRDSRRLTYGALSFIAVTVGGMLALQAKTMAAGKDPLPMDASREGLNTWLRAMVQGGGLGI
jgi:hypothetical protein